MIISKSKLVYILVPIVFCSFLGITLLVFPLSKYPIEVDTFEQTEVLQSTTNGNISLGISNYIVESIQLEIPIETSITLPDGYSLDLSAPFPSFTASNQEQLIVKAGKNDAGIYNIYLKDSLSELFNENLILELVLSHSSIDTAAISRELRSYLGSETENYGIYIFDLKRNEEFGINFDNEFRSASMVKVPMAIAIMKEVEEGNLSLNDIYPLRNDLIFNYEVGAGSYVVGSPLLVKDYLSMMIQQSDNTSLSHIDAILSEIYGSGLNERIYSTIGVNFFVYPPETTPKSVATVLKGLYDYSFLSRDSSEYILELMKNSLPDLKEGIGLALPSGIEYANKIGFLNTNEDLSYMDSAVVYGETTDYILVIMNRNQDWEYAREKIQGISLIIYSNLN